MNTKEKQHAIRIIKNLFILIILFFIVDRILGFLIGYKFQKAEHGDIQTFTHSITNPTEDIFIYGSSRALHGYDCNVLTQTTGYTSFNNGKENSTILYHDLILNQMLKKHAPKIIILDFAPKELSWGESENSRSVLANTILPYAIHDTAFAGIARQQFPQEYIKARLSWLYAYKSAIIPLFNTKKNQEQDQVNGYRPLTGSKVKPRPLDYGNEAELPDTAAKNAFDAFVQTAVENHIKLYVIHSPIFVKPYSTTQSIDYAKPVLKKYNIEFWDYAFDTSFYKPELFYDYIHLNKTGAALFSKKIGERIKQDQGSTTVSLQQR
jgi:hypothetical protein